MTDLLGWTVASAVLVLLVPLGYALVASGFTRAQNATHTMASVVLLSAIGLLGYWATGFAVQAHGSIFFGWQEPDPGVAARFLFLAAMASVAVVIPAGALAERWRIASLALVGLAMSLVVYPLVARWVWGGGWLASVSRWGLSHGAIDIAGSGVVHLVGGTIAVAGAIVVGPRARKFSPDGRPQALPGHHVPMAIAGTLVMAIGWFGFVMGQGLVATDVPVGLAVTNTVMASAAAGLSAASFTWWRFGAPDPSFMANGLVAGLVSIAAGCGVVSVPSAIVIGAIAGVLVVSSVFVLERTFRIDDPVGAISIHGTCGAWGLVAVGLFADGLHGGGINGVERPVAGLFHGDAAQLAAQVLTAVATIVFVFVTSFVVFKVIGITLKNRVPAESEFEGLDVSEMGTIAYPDFSVAASRHDPTSLFPPSGR